MPAPLECARTVIQLEIDELESMLKRLSSEHFPQAVQVLLDTLSERGKIVVLGIGKSGNIGHKIAATLNSTGAPTVVLNSQNALHGDLGIIAPGDAVIALSQSGETSELLDLLPHVKRRDVQLIALTGTADSTLAEHANVILDTKISREACPLNLAPTSSTTCMLVMGDALAMALLEAREFTEEDFAIFHPGGSLGRALLTRVSDIMRGGETLPLASASATVQDAIETMSKARAGACILINPDQSLAGIFTHGDFARAFQASPDIGRRPVADFMTVSPITISADSLAAAALKTIGENRVDDIVVLDDSGCPVGLIDTQDLARMKIV